MIVYLPVVEMRSAPDSRSKVVSQALFGEKVQIKALLGNWIQIATPEGYEGWAQKGAFFERKEPYLGHIEITRLSAHLYAETDTEYGPILTLPYGSKLETLAFDNPRWHKVRLIDGKEAFIQKGDVAQEPFELISFSKKFLGIPYTWGGRSSFGFDCSGFVQMVYARMGVQLPRDAREQILVGQIVSVLELGDLIFWGKAENDIRHVGMSLGADEFIHTSSRENMPYLRISKLTDAEWNGSKSAHYPYRTMRRISDAGVHKFS